MIVPRLLPVWHRMRTGLPSVSGAAPPNYAVEFTMVFGVDPQGTVTFGVDPQVTPVFGINPEKAFSF